MKKEQIFAVEKTRMFAEMAKFAEVLMSNNDSFIPMDMDQFAACAAPALMTGRRHELETDERFLQLIVYTVMHRKNAKGENEFFAYKRVASGEDRLKDKTSIGIGGHTDFADAYDGISTDGEVCVMRLLMDASKRETDEEVHFSYSGTGTVMSPFNAILDGSMIGVIYDAADSVGRVHLGAVVTLEVDENADVRMKEAGMVSLGFKTAEQIESTNMEGWTKILLDRLKEEIF